MKFAIFDCETTGLFRWDQPADAEGQPRLAHLCMALLDEDYQMTEILNAFVRPDGWSMSAETSREAREVNKLTDEFLMEHGRPIASILDDYASVIEQGYALAAYNAQYDTKIMRGEFRRANRDDLFARTPNVCLMRASMGIVKKASGKGFPKLSDAVAHFGIAIPHAADMHAAHVDTFAAMEILRHLARIGALPAPIVHYAKNRPNKEA